MKYPDSTTRKIFNDRPINEKIASRIIRKNDLIKKLKKGNGSNKRIS